MTETKLMYGFILEKFDIKDNTIYYDGEKTDVYFAKKNGYWHFYDRHNNDYLFCFENMKFSDVFKKLVDDFPLYICHTINPKNNENT